MQHKKRIGAFLLLGVFLLTLLHNVVPHFHHSHSDEGNHIVVADLENSHSHDHTHNHDSDVDIENAFLIFFGHHSHNIPVYDQLLLISPKLQKGNKSIKLALHSNTTSLEPYTKLLSANTFPHFRERLCISTFPRSIPLRGPPSLV
jgi:hypothetical protein